MVWVVLRTFENRITEIDHNIDCKIKDSSALGLNSEFVKKHRELPVRTKSTRELHKIYYRIFHEIPNNL